MVRDYRPGRRTDNNLSEILHPETVIKQDISFKPSKTEVFDTKYLESGVRIGYTSEKVIVVSRFDSIPVPTIEDKVKKELLETIDSLKAQYLAKPKFGNFDEDGSIRTYRVRPGSHRY